MHEKAFNCLQQKLSRVGNDFRRGEGIEREREREKTYTNSARTNTEREKERERGSE